LYTSNKPTPILSEIWSKTRAGLRGGRREDRDEEVKALMGVLAIHCGASTGAKKALERICLKYFAESESVRWVVKADYPLSSECLLSMFWKMTIFRI
jgi:hypothetical protein